MPPARVSSGLLKLFGAILALGALILIMFDFQTQLIFPTHAVAAPGPLPRGAVKIGFQADDGTQLHGVHIPPARKSDKSGMLILAFAGNAWNSEDAADFLHQVYPEADIVAFHYRGYRPSGGTPSAEALLADALPVHDYAVSLVKPSRTVAVGFSIGTGVAAHLAAQRKLDGLILVTPFDSLKAVAADLYPMLPIRLLFRHEMDSANALRKSKTPTAILAAQHDSLIPTARTDGLRQSVGNLAFDQVIAGAGHNDIYQRSEFHDAMRKAFAAIIA
jgi:pimeloyl-ACP methyl ester carboxylesterase